MRGGEPVYGGSCVNHSNGGSYVKVSCPVLLAEHDLARVGDCAYGGSCVNHGDGAQPSLSMESPVLIPASEWQV